VGRLVKVSVHGASTVCLEAELQGLRLGLVRLALHGECKRVCVEQCFPRWHQRSITYRLYCRGKWFHLLPWRKEPVDMHGADAEPNGNVINARGNVLFVPSYRCINHGKFLIP
jgi:hypothetical protein